MPVDTHLSLVSPRRLGAALHVQRGTTNATTPALSRRCDGWWSPEELIDVERGNRLLDDASVVSLCRVYGLPGRGLADPEALELVLDRSGSSDLVDPLDEPMPASELLLSTLVRLTAIAKIVEVEQPSHLGVRLLTEALGVSNSELAEGWEWIEDHGDGRVEHVAACLADRIAVPAAGLLVSETPIGTLLLGRRAGGAIRPGPEVLPAAGPLRWFTSAPVGV